MTKDETETDGKGTLETDGTYHGATFDEFRQIIETCTKQNRNLIWGKICPKQACYNGEICPKIACYNGESCKGKKPFTDAGLIALFEYLQEIEVVADWDAEDLTEEQEVLWERSLTELCCLFFEYENLEQFNRANGTKYAEIDKIRCDAKNGPCGGIHCTPTIVIKIDDNRFIAEDDYHSPHGLKLIV